MKPGTIHSQDAGTAADALPRERARRTLELLARWKDEDSAEQTAALRAVMASLDAERTGQRLLFHRQ